MSDNNNTLAAVTVSDWQCEISGDAPDGFSVPAPTVETVTDENGDFEISTVTVSFAGTAEYGTHAFSLNYSFKLSSGENLVDLYVSSDDNATLTACGKTASSKLKSPGRARSDWSVTRMGVTEVSGTYTNVGGPHNMTATILVIRSLTGKIYGVNFNVSGPKDKVEDLYEFTEVTVTCSGDAPYGCFGFTATECFSMRGGNLVEISMSSDDAATVTAGTFSASSRFGSAGSAKSDWIDEPSDVIPVSVSLTNVGGPFSLTVVIKTKRTLVEMYFKCNKPSAKEVIRLNETQYSSDAERNDAKNAMLIARTMFGCGESVDVLFRHIKTGADIGNPSITAKNENVSDNLKLKTDYVAGVDKDKGNEYTAQVTVLDEYIIKKIYTVRVPKQEFGVEFSPRRICRREYHRKVFV